jgi:putative Holliday junction resolvase
MGLDVGDKRIGIALSDPFATFAQPHATLARGRAAADVMRLAAVAREHEVTALVVGLPLHMSGEESAMAAKIRAFGDRLGWELGLAVTYWDERLTSQEAERTLIAGGVRRNKRKQVIDQVAAVLILQGYLDSVGGEPWPSPNFSP